jgi:hypothetical protein
VYLCQNSSSVLAKCLLKLHLGRDINILHQQLQKEAWQTKQRSLHTFKMLTGSGHTEVTSHARASGDVLKPLQEVQKAPANAATQPRVSEHKWSILTSAHEDALCGARRARCEMVKCTAGGLESKAVTRNRHSRELYEAACFDVSGPIQGRRDITAGFDDCNNNTVYHCCMTRGSKLSASVSIT